MRLSPEQHRTKIAPRIGPRAETARRRISKFPLLTVRKQIWDQACELAIAGDRRDLVAVIANRFRIPERTVVLAILGEGIFHERSAAVLHAGIGNLLSSARELRAEIDAELYEVA